MRIGKLGSYNSHSKVPTPDAPDFAFLYKFTGDGLLYLKTSDGNSVVAGSGISDAPSDGNQYARKNATWEQVPPAGISDAPSDGNQYARKDADWEQIPTVDEYSVQVWQPNASIENSPAIALTKLPKKITILIRDQATQLKYSMVTVAGITPNAGSVMGNVDQGGSKRGFIGGLTPYTAYMTSNDGFSEACRAVISALTASTLQIQFSKATAVAYMPADCMVVIEF